jgi:hypothetical protein
VVVRGGPGGTAWVLSILRGHDRRGPWRIARVCNVVDVMGGGELDLRDAELSDRVTRLNVYSVMGGSDIRVPSGVRVEVSGFAIRGGHDVRLGDELADPDAPVLYIRLVAVLGGSSVRRHRG